MFGKRLKELREKYNYSMDKLIELYNGQFDAKMNKSTLSRYENGMQDPIYTVVVNLADFFGVTVDYIVGKDIKNSVPPRIASKLNRLNDTGKEKAEAYIDGLLINEKYTCYSEPEYAAAMSISKNNSDVYISKNTLDKIEDVESVTSLNRQEDNA